MKLHTISLSIALLLAVSLPLHAQEKQGLSLATAQALYPDNVTATGRIHTLTSAKIGSRVNGYIGTWGKDDNGQPLDVGMHVRAGQVLFSLDPSTFQNNVAVAEAGVAAAKAHLADLTAPTRQEQIDQLRNSVAELDARITDKEREEVRYVRLVEQDKTLPVRRLEEVQTDLSVLRSQRAVAAARLAEAQNGATATRIAIAQAQVQQAEAQWNVAKTDLKDSTVRAPFDGVITHRFRSVGDYVTGTPFTEVIELVATKQLEAEFALPEAYFSAVQAGVTRAVLHSPLLQQDFSTTITRVVSEIDQTKGTFVVRVAVPNEAAASIVPGAFVTADINVGATGRGAIVPLRAIQIAEGRPVVYVVENSKMIRCNVEMGDRLTEGAVVKSGLQPGQQVVVGPAEALADGAPLPTYLSSVDSK